MKIAILKETTAGEKRVAVSPETVKKLIAKGFDIIVEAGCGSASSFVDEDYRKAGAVVESDLKLLLDGVDILLAVQPPTTATIKKLKEGAIVIAPLKPQDNAELLEQMAKAKISAFSLEMVPRISRAQSMDILSSQANLAGYKAVLMAANEYTGLFPMLMTAAGTVRPAKVLVIGAGVAGLQAIATAKRLGAVVSAFDIRPAVKEQVQSLGADFVDIDLGIDGDGAGGYARQLSEEERQRQVELLGEVLKKQDIVITTAAVPGRAAPTLISNETVEGMKTGSVIVDLAAETGGNCAATKPGEVIVAHGVTIIGTTNIPSLVATEASNLFARNLLKFIENMLNDAGVLAIDLEDEIVAGSLLTHNGAIVHPNFAPASDETAKDQGVTS